VCAVGAPQARVKNKKKRVKGLSKRSSYGHRRAHFGSQTAIGWGLIDNAAGGGPGGQGARAAGGGSRAGGGGLRAGRGGHRVSCGAVGKLAVCAGGASFGRRAPPWPEQRPQAPPAAARRCFNHAGVHRATGLDSFVVRFRNYSNNRPLPTRPRQPANPARSNSVVGGPFLCRVWRISRRSRPTHPGKRTPVCCAEE
jgi:hypothetical protein